MFLLVSYIHSTNTHLSSQSDPFTHPVEYSPSDKKTVNRTSTKFPDAEVDTDVH